MMYRTFFGLSMVAVLTALLALNTNHEILKKNKKILHLSGSVPETVGRARCKWTLIRLKCGLISSEMCFTINSSRKET